jgi:hypothetical protein
VNRRKPRFVAGKNLKMSKVFVVLLLLALVATTTVLAQATNDTSTMPQGSMNTTMVDAGTTVQATVPAMSAAVSQYQPIVLLVLLPACLVGML